MRFGSRLREIRKSRGLGIKVVGKKVGVNVAYLSRIESGRVQPSEEVIRKLARALRHDEAEMMLLADRVPPAWRPTIHKSPLDASMLIRESLESYEAGSPAAELYEPSVEAEQAELDEALLAEYLAWATHAMRQLEDHGASRLYRACYASWRDAVEAFVVPDEHKFRLHAVLMHLAFLLIKSTSKENAYRLEGQLWPETWRPVAELIPPLARLSNGGATSAAASWHPELFQRLYTALNVPEDIREFGKVYTPVEIASYILEELGFAGKRALSGRLLDPAAGCGIFILEAGRRLLQAAGKGPEARSLLAENLAGLDNDLTAVCLTRVGFGLLLSREGHRLSADTKFGIHLTDTLNSPREELFPGPDAGGSDIKLQRGRYAEGFDFVVGNPPYGKVPSTDPRVQNFKETIYGHANMYGMFLQFALERLSAKGRLGFIVPKSFASGLYFKRLRRFMLDRIHLDEVLTFGSRTNVFQHSDVLQETVVLMGSRGTNRATVVLKEAQDHLSLANPSDRVEVPLAEVDLGRDFEHVLCTSANRTALDILGRVRRQSKPLEALGLRASTGKFVWNRFKEALHHKSGPNRAPLYWMHNLRPFRFIPEGHSRNKAAYVELTPKTRSCINAPEDLVLTKRISAKEQKRRIEACFVPASWRPHTEGYFLENHLNFIFKKNPGCAYDLLCLSALLNSKLLDFVFRVFNGNTQVSATELNILPLPLELPARFKALAAKMAKAAVEEHPLIEERLNEEVYDLFGLPERERAYVEDYFRRYGR